MSWRQAARQLGRVSTRLLMALLLLLLMLGAVVLATLGSESGSRWLLQRGLSLQSAVSARYVDGTFLRGLTLRDVRWQGHSAQMHLQQLRLRWAVWPLLLGRWEVAELRAEGLVWQKRLPPSDKPVLLPTIALPLHVVLEDAEIRDIRINSYHAPGATSAPPLRFAVFHVAADGQGHELRIKHLGLQHPNWGQVSMTGQLRLTGDYPLRAKGQWLPPSRLPQLGAVSVTLSRSVRQLDWQFASTGWGAMTGQGRVEPLAPDLPYRAALTWSSLVLPLWPDEQLASASGRAIVEGRRRQLHVDADMKLKAKRLPLGRYRAIVDSDFSSLSVQSFRYQGELGRAEASGRVRIDGPPTWSLKARFEQLDVASRWPTLAQIVPVLTGDFVSDSHRVLGEQTSSAALRLDSGEQWIWRQTGASPPWDRTQAQRINLEWQHVQRDIPRVGTVLSPQGQLAFRGLVSNYQAETEFVVDGERLGPLQLNAKVTGQGDLWAISEAVLTLLTPDGARQGQISLRAEGELRPVLGARGHLHFKDWPTERWLPEWPALLQGQTGFHVALGAQYYEWGLDQAQLQGQLRQAPFSVSGQGVLRLPVQAGHLAAQTQGLALRWGKNQLQLDGGYWDEKWNLSGTAESAEPERFLPGSAGQGKATFRLMGPWAEPDVMAHLEADSIRYQQLTVGRVLWDMTLARLGQTESQSSLSVDALSYGELSLDKAQATAQGRQDDHGLSLMLAGPTLQVAGTGRGAWQPSMSRWQGQLASAQLGWMGMDWQLNSPAAVTADMKQPQIEVAPHCWQSAEANLCSVSPLAWGQQNAFHLTLAGLQAATFNRMLPNGLAVTGIVNGEAQGQWSRDQAPALNAHIVAKQGAVIVPAAAGSTSSLPAYRYDEVRASLSTQAGRWQSRAQLQSPDMGRAQLSTDWQPANQQAPIEGQFDVQQFPLALVQPFVRAVNTLGGTASAQGRFAGTTTLPQLWGKLRWVNGVIAAKDIPLNFSHVDAEAEFQGESALIVGTLANGPGQAAVKGIARWPKAVPEVSLTIQGERLLVTQPPLLLAEVNPNLDVEWAPSRLAVKGNLTVPMARLMVSQLGSKATPLSPDVRVLSKTATSALTPTSSVMRTTADVGLRLGDDVLFQGYGVNGRLQGALVLKQQPGRSLEVNGDLQLANDARYEAYGQRLDIRRGRLIFAGNPTQPGLDVEAVRDVDGTIVGLRVAGRANAPEVVFFSDKGDLPQEEILSYLLLGRPLNDPNAKDGNSLSATTAALKLGTTGGSELTSRLGDKIGVADLSLEAQGSGESTQVAVSGYLGPRLYLRYGVGVFTPVNTASLRYKISPKLYLEAVTSLESAVDVFYSLKF